MAYNFKGIIVARSMVLWVQRSFKILRIGDAQNGALWGVKGIDCIIGASLEHAHSQYTLGSNQYLI